MPEQGENYIEELITRYILGNITSQEQLELDAWMHSSPANREIFDRLTDKKYLVHGLNELHKYNAAQGWEKIRSQFYFSEPPKVRVVKRWRMLAVAASVLLMAGLAAIYKWGITGKPAPENGAVTSGTAADIIKAPEINHARITLADGSVIYLDTMAIGSVKRLHNIEIVKAQDGKIMYNKTGGAANDTAEMYNTLSNPRGSKVIDVSLSDGSRVWLNAGSYLKYPVAFLKDTRKVLVSGEAYFEVAPVILLTGKSGSAKRKRPFIVQNGASSSGVPGWEVEVLGTRFNVNAYADEQSVRIALIEGAIKVQRQSTHPHQLLSAGKQLIINNKTKASIQTETNEQEVLAWKNGIFLMENTDLSVVMRQISRWYNVEIVYPNGVPDAHLSGDIPNTMSLNKVLQVLELSGIQFQTKGKKVIVLN